MIKKRPSGKYVISSVHSFVVGDRVECIQRLYNRGEPPLLYLDTLTLGEQYTVAYVYTSTLRLSELRQYVFNIQNFRRVK